MATHQDIHHARVNGSAGYQYHTGKTITVHQLVDLVIQSSKSNRHTCIRRASNFLLEKMANGKWKVKANAHKGGFGGKGKAPDNTSHITISVGGNSYHLRMDAKGHLFMITGPGIDNSTPPWIAPGSYQDIT